ncbi:MAG: SUMF1/EgtB/PvdO family nonheme iron enzyme [Chitinivibrionales bacterium]|nr:SUMF1/EgtB/PvdO family nonheme iron enzyme [Chitinivibrionales bacterium]
MCGTDYRLYKHSVGTHRAAQRLYYHAVHIHEADGATTDGSLNRRFPWAVQRYVVWCLPLRACTRDRRAVIAGLDSIGEDSPLFLPFANARRSTTVFLCRLSGTAVLLVALLACESDDPTPQEPRPAVCEPLAAMVPIQATGDTVRLGSTDRFARIDEMPVMHVAFTYDFAIDTAEVTIGGYERLTGELPPAYGGVSPGDNLPVCGVSWFDAVLYCNRRSVWCGKDTVYVYDARDTTDNGVVVGLQGLRVRFDREGYRLPTEAEWVYAARGSDTSAFMWGDSADDMLAAQEAWYIDNSGNRAQPVASREPNERGVYDMTGNAMEWVHDWNVALAETTVVNYVGPTSAIDDDHVVKGGSFQHGIDYLRPSARSDDYASPSVKAARYLGFRCVIGAIGTTTEETAPVDTSRSTASYPEIAGLSGVAPSTNVKVVYVKKTAAGRILACMDYGCLPPRETEYRESFSYNLPTISPDGQWVAFCTGGEGEVGESRVYVHRLDSTGSGRFMLPESPAYVPRWWVDPSTSDTFIVYTTNTALNTTPAWRSGATLRQRVAGGAPVGTPELLTADGSYHGGLTADGRHLVTGYDRLRLLDLQTGDERILFTGPGNGKSASDTSQVCNVSVSPEGDRALHLDFGYRDSSTLVGEPYGVHQYLFVTDWTNENQGFVRGPSSSVTWDHAEYTNYPGFAVAALEYRGFRPLIMLVDLGAKRMASLLSVGRYGDDFWHPYGWIGPETLPDPGLALDSLGDYQGNYGWDSRVQVLARMVPTAWELRDSLEIACIGSSRMYNGLDPRLITHGWAWNFAWGGACIEAIYRLAVEYIAPHAPRLKAVAITFNPGWLGADTSTTFYRPDSNFTKTPGYRYDRSHNFWRDSLPPGTVEHILRAPNPPRNTGDSLRGFVPRECRSWMIPDGRPTSWTTADTQYVRRFGLLTAMADSLAARQVHLLVIGFPLHPAYRAEPCYGRYGPTWEVANDIIAMLRDVESVNEYFHFHDGHKGAYHDYLPHEASDSDHLCTVGAERFTAEVDSVLGTFLH